MKVLFLFSILSSVAFAQDPASYLKNFDTKVYSLKSKGAKDFAVDIESSRLTKQLNDQQMFGKVEEVIFRVFWTAEPERLAIEVMGLPDGFKEIKEELKGSILSLMDNLIPQTSAQRFNGYKFIQGPKPKEITAQDTSGLAPIPSFVLKFDEQDKLVLVTGNKPIGTFEVKPVYEKESFADGKWVLTEQTTTSSENGQTLKVSKELDYGKSEGIAVLTEVEVITEQTLSGSKNNPPAIKEKVEFKNYKINQGVALKYFLGEAKDNAPVKAPVKK